MPINEGIVETVKILVDSILIHVKTMSTVVNRTQYKKLYCKGIHKTLIDFIVLRSSSNIVEKVVIYNTKKNKYVKFFGVDGGEKKFSPKELAIYVFILSCSINKKKVCVNIKN